MSLRPRYSLLTLLVLTALVAGGVKLWYGPHHVVEQVKPGEEIEYTYTRDWQGDKILQGPYIAHTILKDWPHVEVSFYRQGKHLKWCYECQTSRGDTPDPSPACNRADSELSDEEWQEFRRAVNLEKQRPIPAGSHRYELEGLTIFVDLSTEAHP